MRISFHLIICGVTALAAVLACGTISAQTRTVPRTATRTVPQRSVRSAPAATRSAPAVTPSGPRAQGGARVAVIDISEVFKNHNRFKQAMEDMRKDVQGFEAVLKQRGMELQKKGEQLQEHKAGSPEYDRIEADIARFRAQVQAETQLKRKEFLQREARVYYDVYTEIVKEVTYFAQRQGIDLVVRFNSGQIDPQDRKSVLEGVNRTVVFQHRLNITYQILDRLNGPVSKTARQSRPPVPRR